MYGSRALFFLTKDGILRPVAIELTQPPTGDKPQWKQVFTPTWDATGCRGWLKLIFVLMTLVITSLSFTGEHYANMNSNHDKLALQSTSSVTDFGQP